MISFRCDEHRPGPRAQSQHLHFRGKLATFKSSTPNNENCCTSMFKLLIFFAILSEERFSLIFEPLSQLCLTFPCYNSTNSSTKQKPTFKISFWWCFFSNQSMGELFNTHTCVLVISNPAWKNITFKREKDKNSLFRLFDFVAF